MQTKINRKWRFNILLILWWLNHLIIFYLNNENVTHVRYLVSNFNIFEKLSQINAFQYLWCNVYSCIYIVNATEQTWAEGQFGTNGKQLPRQSQCTFLQVHWNPHSERYRCMSLVLVGFRPHLHRFCRTSVIYSVIGEREK